MSLRDVTLGMPFCWFDCSVLFDALELFLEFRSFRLSRVSSEVWLDVGSMFKLGLDVKAASYFGVAPSFKEARFSSREQREQRAGGPLFRWTDVRASTSALPMKGFL